MPDFDEYQSPFTWRYGSPVMRRIWSEVEKRRLWRQIWLALAETEAAYGLVSPAQLEDLRTHVADVQIERSLQIEAEIQHDLMAELRAYSEQAPAGGAVLHMGATSADIEDNADALRVRSSIALIRGQLRDLLLAAAGQIERWADQPVIALTHLQPAEPTTLGYRFALYAQDWLAVYGRLDGLLILGKGFKGAVGTGAAFSGLIGPEHFDAFEKLLSEKIQLPFYPVSGQTYPRLQDYEVVSLLARLGAALYKFAFDLRLLQSPFIGEVAEPFGKRQVGSSAMPFKRNPIQLEKIDSLGRFLAGLPRLAWDNAAHSLFERTLDDSANRRTLLPEAFLAADEMLRVANRVLSHLQVDQAAIERNLERFAGFSAIEPVLMALTRSGGDRQELHERLRQHAMHAWDAINAGQPNPIQKSVVSDPELTRLVPAEELTRLFQLDTYVGIAPQRSRQLAAEIRKHITA